MTVMRTISFTGNWRDRRSGRPARRRPGPGARRRRRHRSPHARSSRRAHRRQRHGRGESRRYRNRPAWCGDCRAAVRHGSPPLWRARRADDGVRGLQAVRRLQAQAAERRAHRFDIDRVRHDGMIDRQAVHSKSKTCRTPRSRGRAAQRRPSNWLGPTRRPSRCRSVRRAMGCINLAQRHRNAQRTGGTRQAHGFQRVACRDVRTAASRLGNTLNRSAADI